MSKKTWKLAVRLAKSEYQLEQCVDTKKIEKAQLKRTAWGNTENGTLFSGTAFSSEPKWRSFFTQSNLPEMKNRGAVSFIVIPIRDRLMVVSFGPSQIYLKSEAFERDFGLKVTLNSVEEKDLISIDAKTPENQSIQKRIQTSHKSDVTAFGIDVTRDLLKGVTGKPKKTSFASLLSGSDTLIIHAKMDEADLMKKCGDILDVYLENSYKTKFPWIDNVRPIKDAIRIEELDNTLLEDINKLLDRKGYASIEGTTMYLAIPEIIDHQYSASYGFTGFGKKVEDKNFALPELQDYINLIGTAEIKLEDLKNKHRVAQRADGNGKLFDKWTIYKCLVYEIKEKNRVHILSEGAWYKVDGNYASHINSSFEKLLTSTDSKNLDFLSDALLTDNETTYIEKLEKTLPKNVVCVHGLPQIKTRDWNSPIEPCDLYSNHRDFIHIKNETSSSTLSHLFMQGLVSAQVYKRSAEYRQLLIDSINKKNSKVGNTLSKEEPKTSDYRIIYAIIRKPYRNGKFNLPFFSKVSLKATVDHLKDLNYKVGLHWIKKL